MNGKLTALLNEMKLDFVEAEANTPKADEGVKAAGTRLRKAMQRIRETAKAIRKESMPAKKAPAA